MEEQSTLNFSRSFISKGRTIKKSCAQIKIKENYLNNQGSLFLQGRSTIHLTPGRTFIVPSYEFFQQFGSILSTLSDVEHNFLILQTVVRLALESGNQQFQKNCKSLLFDTTSSSSVIFLNESSRETYSNQQELETQSQYKLRIFKDACVYLLCNFNCSIVVLCCDELDPLYSINDLCGIPVEYIQTYLKKKQKIFGESSLVLPNIICQADEILSSLREGFRLKEEEQDENGKQKSSVGRLKVKKNVYSPHLSVSDIKIGLDSGSLLKGKIIVSSHNSGEAKIEANGGTIMINGRKDMNRSLDGDEVVVRVNVREKWGRSSGSLTLSHQLDAVDSDAIDDAISDDVTDLETQTNASFNGGTEGLLITGVIVGILKREISEIVVTIPSMPIISNESNTVNDDLPATSTALDKEEFLLAPPIDKKLPKIRLRTRQWSKLQGYRVVLTFDSWPLDSVYPNGHLVRIIGQANDWKTEIESLLIRHSIFPRPFSPAALACVTVVPVKTKAAKATETQELTLKNEVTSKRSVWVDSEWVMPSDKLLDLHDSAGHCHRRDYRRERRVFSVDPPGCQDIDDAMSVHWVEGMEGVLEVAVSIADVCEFLPHGCALDLEAQARGTTVYLTHTRMDMLPSLISGDVASLHGGRDRYAVTVTWHVAMRHRSGRPVVPTEDPLILYDDGDILFDTPTLHSCGRTAIRSVAAMTYDQAHNLIHGRAPDPHPSTVPPGQAGQGVGKHLWDGLRKDLKWLTVFGRFLKSQREINGALDLTQKSGELKFKLSDDGEPVDVDEKEAMEIHGTIAELMIIANSTVARIIDNYRPGETLVRIHPPPPPSKLKLLQDVALQAGLETSPSATPGEVVNYSATKYTL